MKVTDKYYKVVCSFVVYVTAGVEDLAEKVDEEIKEKMKVTGFLGDIDYCSYEIEEGE